MKTFLIGLSIMLLFCNSSMAEDKPIDQSFKYYDSQSKCIGALSDEVKKLSKTDYQCRSVLGPSVALNACDNDSLHFEIACRDGMFLKDVFKQDRGSDWKKFYK